MKISPIDNEICKECYFKRYPMTNFEKDRQFPKIIEHAKKQNLSCLCFFDREKHCEYQLELILKGYLWEEV